MAKKKEEETLFEKEIFIFDRKGLKHLKTRITYTTGGIRSIVLKTEFSNEDYELLFSVSGHHKQDVCESIFLLRNNSYKSGWKNGRNDLRKNFNNLMEKED